MTTAAAAERAVRLFRVSTNGQTEDNQIAEVDAHIAARGYTVVKTLQLHDVSASAEGEELEANLAQVLADITAGEYTVIVTAHSSRIDRRNPKTAMRYLLSVDMAGGRVESVREPDFRLDNLAGWITTVMAQHANHEYARTLREHTAAGMAKVKKNEALDGLAPWGYVSDGGPKHNKAMVPTAEGRRYVPVVYAKAVAGVSVARIAEWLDAEGVPPPAGRRWWPKTVLRLLRNPAYKGLRCRRVKVADPVTGKVTEQWGHTPVHRCEALVDAATWQRAQEALSSVSRRRRGPAPAGRAMLAGAILCGSPDCTAGPDSPMYRVTPTSEHVYYRCYGRGPGRKGCGNMVSLPLADRAVDRLLTTKFTHPVLARRLVPGNAAELDAQLDDVKAEIAGLGTRDLDDAAYDAELKRLRAERDELQAAERTADRFELLPTGDTYAALWDGLETAQRGTWLRQNGITVRADKKGVKVAQDLEWDQEAVLPLLPKRADLAPGGSKVAYYIKFADLD